MCQRCEVTRAAERAVLVHHRGDAGVQHRGVGFRHDGTHAGTPSTQRGEAKQHGGAHHFLLHLRAGTRSMGAHKRNLQLLTQLVRDVASGKRTEAGGDAVDRSRVFSEFFNASPRFCNCCDGLRVDGHRGVVTGNGHNICDAEGTDAYLHSGGLVHAPNSSVYQRTFALKFLQFLSKRLRAAVSSQCRYEEER